jgi:hypothetical protein
MITTWDNHVCHTNLHKEHRWRKNNNSALGETCASPKHYISILVLHCHHGNARKKRWTSAIPRSGRAPSHTEMLFEPMNQVVARDETETLWHVDRGSSPWSPDLDTVNFIWCIRRRGTSLPAIIHAPNCKTVNATTTANTTTTRKSVGHRPPDTNLVRSKYRREDRAICLPTPPIEWCRDGEKLEANYADATPSLP